MNYDKAYFIAKFESIPEELWCTELLSLPTGNFPPTVQHCAFGHCGVTSLFDDLNEEAAALEALLPRVDGEWWRTGAVNDGKHPKYQQPTPKARILAALHDLP